MVTSITGRNSPVRQRRDYRVMAITAIMVMILSVGYLVQILPIGKKLNTIEEIPAEHLKLETMKAPEVEQVDWNIAAEPRVNPHENPRGHQKQARSSEARLRFSQAVALLNARHYDAAITILERMLELESTIPEAYANMGYAYLGKQDYSLARDFFMKAIDLNPALANAHYGIAIAYENLGDLESALGGMRGFLHLTRNLTRFMWRGRDLQSGSGRRTWAEVRGDLPKAFRQGLPGSRSGAMEKVWER